MSEEQQNIENLGLTQLEEALRLCYKLFRWIFLLLVIAFLFSGVHKISPGKVGYVQRFGKWLEVREEPGVHFAFPFMIDRVYEFDVSKACSIEIDDFIPLEGTAQGMVSNQVLLTSDHNLIHSRWRLNYRHSDPLASYRLLGEPDEEIEQKMMKDIFLGVCVREIASKNVKTLLEDQDGIKAAVKQGMQDYLGRLDTGYEVTRIDLIELRVPDKVKEAFERVFAEAAAKKKAINDANTAARKLNASINAIKQEKIEMAKAVASQINSDLKAEAKNLTSLLASLKKEDQELYLKTKLLSVMKRVFDGDDQQLFLLREGSELRLKLNRDPLLEKLHQKRRQDEEAARKAAAEGAAQ